MHPVTPAGVLIGRNREMAVGTMRPVPQRDDLLALRRTAGDATRLELAGLIEAGAVELAGGSAPDSLSAAIADRLGFVAGPVREALRATGGRR